MDFDTVHLPLLVIIPILPLLLLLFNKKRTVRPASKLPPGPPKLPILGNMHQVRRLPHRDLWRLSKKYGSLMQLQLGKVPTLVVSSAAMAREVMRSHDQDLCSRPACVSYKKLSYNFDVAFMPYGEYWRKMRKIFIQELFSTKRVQSFAHIREEEVAKMMKIISSAAASSSSISLSEVLVTLTFNITSRAAFGRSFEGGSEREKTELHKAMEEAGTMLGGFFVEDFLPWMGWVDVLTGLRRRLKWCFLKLDAFYEKVIDDHIHYKGPKPDREDFVDVLLGIRNELDLTRDQMKGILMDVLIGGTDTSSTTVVWAMTELIRNPKAMQEVQEEVRRIVKRNEKVEEMDLPKLQYLKSVVKETLRMHPPDPLLIPRESIRQCTVGGYDIAPKTMIFVNSFAIGRDPESWESPDEFLPERFMSNSIDYKGQDFEFIPFGAGRRICPGLFFGSLNVELALANLLYLFYWELPPGLEKENMGMNEMFGVVVHKEPALRLVPIAYNNMNN